MIFVAAGCDPSGWRGVDDGGTGRAVAECPREAPVQVRVRLTGRGEVIGAADGGCFERGAEVVLDARAADGWVFGGWFGNATSVQPVIALALDADTTVEAVFRRIPQAGVTRVFAPFPAGTASVVLQGPFGAYTHGSETAWDFHLPWGTEVLAAADGVVVEFEEGIPRNEPGRPPREGPANFVMLEHGDGWFTRYVHLDTDGVFVEIGQAVRRGERVGVTGDTGLTFDPHLHFETRGAEGEPLVLGFAESLRRDGAAEEGDVIVSQNRAPLVDPGGF
ncbi:MAG: M23 family metallopeptidase [Phycisphaerae bacterium]|nr:M23 family metallopeptidase [Planctomycetia bacterium]MCK6463687.1 M23 family metallopeptidase [Phycisphaerae bacterium]MCL4718356.1 M23 family metallopeptidase [Phycisphaerae bacterium]NUQ10387.1 M23 family metallopeptidase [Phycisphaerae bacterium]